MSTHENAQEAFDKGVKQGIDDATLAAHSEHLRRINGSIDHMTEALQNLERGLQDHGVKMTGELARLDRELTAAMSEVASDVRTLNEDQRARDVRVESAREALAEQTERRREGLEEGGWKFTRVGQAIAALVGLIGLAVTIYLATGR